MNINKNLLFDYENVQINIKNKLSVLFFLSVRGGAGSVKRDRAALCASNGAARPVRGRAEKMREKKQKIFLPAQH